MQYYNKRKLVFKTYTPNQTLLFPSNLEELIDQNHPVRTVDQVIDQINIDPLIARFKGGGSSSYHPRMLLKVLVYAYLTNTYTSRKIEAAVKENIHFMWLSGMSKPDHNTINRFRSDRLRGILKEVFAQIVELLVDQGLISLKEIYTDGTKMEANANRYSFVWGRTIKINKERIGKQLKELWEYTQKIAREELMDTEPMEFDQLDAQKVTQTIDKIDQALSDKPVKKKVKQKLNYAKKHWPANLKKYEQQEKILVSRNSYSKTDPGATFMRMKEDYMGNGQLKPAYNWQISTTDQFIVNYSLHQTTTDTITLKPHLEQFEKLYKRLPESICADAGYGSEENYELLAGKSINNFVKYNYFHKEQTDKWKQDPFRTDNLYYNESQDIVYCPMGQPMNKVGERERTTDNGYVQNYSQYQAKNCQNCPQRGPCYKGKGNRKVEISHKLRKHKQKVRHNLLGEEGLRHRSKRPVDVEPVFASIKHNKGYKRFLLRGLDKVEIEIGILAIAHNLAKLAG
jgi:transposase